MHWLSASACPLRASLRPSPSRMTIINRTPPSHSGVLPRRLRLPTTPLPISNRLCFSHKGKPLRLRLTSLPSRVLDKIYASLPHPRTQIAFALTCRTLASVVARSPTTLKQGLIRRRGGLTSYDKEHLLKDLVRWGFIDSFPDNVNSNGKSSDASVPGQSEADSNSTSTLKLSSNPIHTSDKATLQLCTTCWTYLPLHRIWRLPSGQPISTLKRVDWIHAVMLWTQSSDEEIIAQGPSDQPKDHIRSRNHARNHIHVETRRAQRKICPSCQCQMPPHLDSTSNSDPSHSTTSLSPYSTDFSFNNSSHSPTTPTPPTNPKTFLQAWPSGFAQGVLRVQEYDDSEEALRLFDERLKRQERRERKSGRWKGVRWFG